MNEGWIVAEMDALNKQFVFWFFSICSRKSTRMLMVAIIENNRVLERKLKQCLPGANGLTRGMICVASNTLEKAIRPKIDIRCEQFHFNYNFLLFSWTQVSPFDTNSTRHFANCKARRSTEFVRVNTKFEALINLILNKFLVLNNIL